MELSPEPNVTERVATVAIVTLDSKATVALTNLSPTVICVNAAEISANPVTIFVATQDIVAVLVNAASAFSKPLADASRLNALLTLTVVDLVTST